MRKEAGVEEGALRVGQRLDSTDVQYRRAYILPGTPLCVPVSKPLIAGMSLTFLLVSLDVCKMRVLLLQPSMWVKEEAVIH